MHYKTDLLNLSCEDNMALMARYPDKYFELAIVDPPYGLDKKLSQGGGKMKNTPFKKLYRDSKQWDKKPSENYFKQLFRISKNQIIWGGNYFELPATRGIICWDKKNYMPSMSRWEYAWTSFDCIAKMYECMSTDLSRFHPTQKPVALYKWLLKNYAKPGDKILDTHLGSGSIAIACHYAGHELTACEIDQDYFKKAVDRIQQQTKQISLSLQ